MVPDTIFIPTTSKSSALGWPPPSTPLRQNLSNDFAMHVRESHIAAAEADGQSLVVEAEQMQHRRVKIVHFHSAGDDLVTPFVGFAVRHSRFDAAAGKPNRSRTGCDRAHRRPGRTAFGRILPP